MIKHSSITPTQLRSLIRSGKLAFAGNQRLKIYGTLSCSSGNRMKKENRVFFKDEDEALEAGFRPCGHCLKIELIRWNGSLYAVIKQPQLVNYLPTIIKEPQ